MWNGWGFAVPFCLSRNQTRAREPYNIERLQKYVADNNSLPRWAQQSHTMVERIMWAVHLDKKNRVDHQVMCYSVFL